MLCFNRLHVWLKAFSGIVFCCNRLLPCFNWLHAILGFVFCFNRLPYILIDYKSLRGSFSSIFNWLHLRFNQLAISAFWFWVKTRANLINYYVTLIDYLRDFCFLCAIHYISLSSPHQPPLLLNLLPPPISTNQIASTFLYKTTFPYWQITSAPPLKPPITILL